MGCGMSRYGMVDAAACGFQPSRKRIDEAANRHDAASVDASPSTKLISKKAGDHDAAQNSRKSVSAPPRKSVSTLEHDETPTVEYSCSTPRLKTTVDVAFEGKGENEEDGGRLSSYDGQMWMNSPSFRDYCQPSFKEYCHRDSDSEGHSDSEKDQSSSRGENCDASPESSEASESKSSRKSKGRALSRVFPKGSSVKHFLHVPAHHHHHHDTTKVSDSHEKHGKPVEKVD